MVIAKSDSGNVAFKSARLAESVFASQSDVIVITRQVDASRLLFIISITSSVNQESTDLIREAHVGDASSSFNGSSQDLFHFQSLSLD